MLLVLWIRGDRGAQKNPTTTKPKKLVPDVDLTQSLGQSVCSAGGTFEEYSCQKSNSNEYIEILLFEICNTGKCRMALGMEKGT